MVGEYIHHQDRIYIKTVRNNTIFSYELQISKCAVMQGRRKARSVMS